MVRHAHGRCSLRDGVFLVGFVDLRWVSYAFAMEICETSLFDCRGMKRRE